MSILSWPDCQNTIRKCCCCRVESLQLLLQRPPSSPTGQCLVRQQQVEEPISLWLPHPMPADLRGLLRCQARTTSISIQPHPARAHQFFFAIFPRLHLSTARRLGRWSCTTSSLFTYSRRNLSFVFRSLYRELPSACLDRILLQVVLYHSHHSVIMYNSLRRPLLSFVLAIDVTTRRRLQIPQDLSR
jgi:hypothetical protein